MNRLIATAVVGIPLALFGAVFGGPSDTAEGDQLISSLEVVEKSMCGCAAGDVMCIVTAAETLENIANRHYNTEGTDSQLRRAEAVTGRIETCMDKAMGPR